MKSYTASSAAYNPPEQ
ncbi:hypothetical protein LINPERHAP1_LOCUS2599 [Linum perenne]